MTAFLPLTIKFIPLTPLSSPHSTPALPPGEDYTHSSEAQTDAAGDPLRGADGRAVYKPPSIDRMRKKLARITVQTRHCGTVKKVRADCAKTYVEEARGREGERWDGRTLGESEVYSTLFTNRGREAREGT